MLDNNVPMQIETYWSFKKQISNYDNIRFRTYRIACKLRHLQKESKFYLVDLFNTIEAFREFGLSRYEDLNALIATTEIQSIIYSIFHQLSSRVPSSQDFNINYSVVLVYNWLLETFKDAPEGFINILAFKIGLTLLCSSLFSNKLKYLFILLSNKDGFLKDSSFIKFTHYINDICNNFENCCIDFDHENFMQKSFNTPLIDVKQFIDILKSLENQVELISWMIVYHRLSDAETVTHNISCDSCDKHSFFGFRYKCKICHNYNQCQECFWIGRSSKNHDPDLHPCKEYLFDNTKNQLGRAFRRSFRNTFRWFPPNKQEQISSKLNQCNDEFMIKKLNLSNIISPQIFRKNRAFLNVNEFKFTEVCPENSALFIDITNTESEHNLIEHYLNILKDQSSSPNAPCFNYESNYDQSFETQIMELEHKNCTLMKRILQLSDRNQNTDYNNANKSNSFFTELSMLRQKKADLEDYLNCLQDKRKKLMFQLDDLMKELKECNLSNEND